MARNYSLDLNSGSGQFTDEFIIFGATSESEAYAALKDYSDDKVEIEGITLGRNKIEINEDGVDLWSGNVTYVVSSPKAVQGLMSTNSWNISYETEHITHGLEWIGDYSADGTNTGFLNALNVKENYGKLEVQGMDIQRSIFNFSKRIEFSPGSITSAKIKQWADIANHINSGSFMGFSAGEVRFNGAQGDEVKSKSSSVSFSFSIKKNQINRKFGDKITVPLIRGWDTHWIFYGYVQAESEADENILAVTKQPTSVHVSSNYYYDGFGSLKFLEGNSSGASVVAGTI